SDYSIRRGGRLPRIVQSAEKIFDRRLDACSRNGQTMPRFRHVLPAVCALRARCGAIPALRQSARALTIRPSFPSHAGSDMIEGKTIFITGGAGFIGSTIVG